MRLSKNLASKSTVWRWNLTGDVTNPLNGLTVSVCARLHGATMQKILNWIKRGNVSPDDFVEIPDFNNLKLIRNKTYELRKYQIIGTPIGT